MGVVDFYISVCGRPHVFWFVFGNEEFVMRDTSEELFDQIVYAVTKLLHGDSHAVYTVYQRVVEGALRHAGVDEMIRSSLVSPIGENAPARNKEMDCG
jgi:hypothetical protein